MEPRDFPDQNGVFNSGALASGLSSSMRSFLLDHFAKFAQCKVCKETPCQHFPEKTPMPDDLLLRVPVVFDESGDRFFRLLFFLALPYSETGLRMPGYLHLSFVSQLFADIHRL